MFPVCNLFCRSVIEISTKAGLRARKRGMRSVKDLASCLMSSRRVLWHYTISATAAGNAMSSSPLFPKISNNMFILIFL